MQVVTLCADAFRDLCAFNVIHIRDENRGTRPHKKLRLGRAHAAGTAGDQSNFSIKPVHFSGDPSVAWATWTTALATSTNRRTVGLMLVCQWSVS